MVAVIWMATGRVESALSSARLWPISAAIIAWPTMVECIRARQKNSSQTCRRIAASGAGVPVFGTDPGAAVTPGRRGDPRAPR